MSRNTREPLLFCLCGPAGGGKTSISRALIEREPALFLSISTTTRAPRGSERDGIAYHFVSGDEFKKRVSNGEFLEFAQYGENFYGTEKRNLSDAKLDGRDLILDIEVQGVEQLKKFANCPVVTIFVMPPSFRILSERLAARGTESQEKIEARLKIAENEIEKLTTPGFSDFLLVNDVFDRSIENARAIIRAERLRMSRVDADIIRQLRR